MPRHFYKKRKGEDCTTRVSSSNPIWGSPLGILRRSLCQVVFLSSFFHPASALLTFLKMKFRSSPKHWPSYCSQLFASQSGGDLQGTPDSCSIIISSFSRGCWSHEEESWPLDSSLSVSLPDPCFSLSAHLEAGPVAPASVPFHSCTFPSSWFTQTVCWAE